MTRKTCVCRVHVRCAAGLGYVRGVIPSSRLPVVRRVALASLLVVVACRKSEAAPVEHDPVQLDESQRTAVNRFVGQWEHVGGQEEHSAAIEAVHSVTADMNSLIRGVAESRLEEAVHIDAAISIEEDQGILIIARSEVAQPFTAPADGREFDLQTPEGDDARGSLRIDGHALVTRVQTDQGGGERTYRIDALGQLVITSRTFSPRLPADVVYEAKYAKR